VPNTPSITPQGDNIMKKSLIWITAGIATVGFGVPAFAARGDSPEHIAPTQVTVATATPIMATSNTVNPATVATVASADDNDANDDNSVDNATSNSVDDNGVDDVTTNSVEDISGPCDEAEHATDPTCTGVTATSTDDNSVHSGGSDDSGHRGGANDN
jgi:hypothetical protein